MSPGLNPSSECCGLSDWGASTPRTCGVVSSSVGWRYSCGQFAHTCGENAVYITRLVTTHGMRLAWETVATVDL